MVIFKENYNFSRVKRGPTFSRGGGVQLIPGGGGSNLFRGGGWGGGLNAYLHRNP